MYTPFRCTECTLMRCSTPNTVCEECMAYVCEKSYNTPQSALDSTILRRVIAQGKSLSGLMSAQICLGPGRLEEVIAFDAPGSIIIKDATPQMWHPSLSSLFEFHNPAAPNHKVFTSLNFQHGLAVFVAMGSFALRFSDQAGNMYLTPY